MLMEDIRIGGLYFLRTPKGPLRANRIYRLAEAATVAAEYSLLRNDPNAELKAREFTRDHVIDYYDDNIFFSILHWYYPRDCLVLQVRLKTAIKIVEGPTSVKVVEGWIVLPDLSQVVEVVWRRVDRGRHRHIMSVR